MSRSVETIISDPLRIQYKNEEPSEPIIHLRLVELFLACDQRLGQERLLRWAKQIELPAVHKILERRLSSRFKLM